MKNIFISLLLVFGIISCRKKNEDVKNVSNKNTNLKKTACYLEITRSKDNPAITDSMSLTVNFDGTKVSGTYNWLPYEKDKKTGTYVGQLEDSIVNAVYTYSAEGQNLKEELVFKLENNRAMIKFGEMEEKNGIWKFKDADKTEYTATLKRTPCK